MNRAATLEQLARLCGLNRDGVAQPAVEPSGTATLDAVLPGGGWQSGTIVELMPTAMGMGELSLLMPALARITHADRPNCHVALIAPPCIPFAPALAQHGVDLEHLLVINPQKPEDILWSFEQTLRCKSFGAVVAWPVSVKDREVRRLQLAAEAGRSIGFHVSIAGGRARSIAGGGAVATWKRMQAVCASTSSSVVASVVASPCMVASWLHHGCGSASPYPSCLCRLCMSMQQTAPP